ncbi:hypothetical protein BJY00DRAFT_285636 [Aspergillus carlsbadensis]|nr:hypothetical protein BJY00DRAFT_285636 [Aspergillus carlsbadensis]
MPPFLITHAAGEHARKHGLPYHDHLDYLGKGNPYSVAILCVDVLEIFKTASPLPAPMQLVLWILIFAPFCSAYAASRAVSL